MGSSKASETYGLIQFSAHAEGLPGRLKADVDRSIFSTRAKYLNAMSERVLALNNYLGNGSCIDELEERLALIDDFPLEQIRQLAFTQNRNVRQMCLHLVQEALAAYPDHCPAHKILNNSDPVSYSKQNRKNALN